MYIAKQYNHHVFNTNQWGSVVCGFDIREGVRLQSLYKMMMVMIHTTLTNQ